MSEDSDGRGNGGYVLIGEINRVRGLIGEVVVTVHADDPARMAALGKVFLKEAGGGYRPVGIEGFKRLGSRAVLKLTGFGSVEEARTLVDRELFIPAEASTPAPEGRYYAYQLVGLEARLKDGTRLGTVREILRQGAQSLLVVAGENDEFMVPMVKAICVDFDLEGRTVTIDPPAGLLELNKKDDGARKRS